MGGVWVTNKQTGGVKSNNSGFIYESSLSAGTFGKKDKSFLYLESKQFRVDAREGATSLYRQNGGSVAPSTAGTREIVVGVGRNDDACAQLTVVSIFSSKFIPSKSRSKSSSSMTGSGDCTAVAGLENCTGAGSAGALQTTKSKTHFRTPQKCLFTFPWPSPALTLMQLRNGSSQPLGQPSSRLWRSSRGWGRQMSLSPRAPASAGPFAWTSARLSRLPAPGIGSRSLWGLRDFGRLFRWLRRVALAKVGPRGRFGPGGRNERRTRPLGGGLWWLVSQGICLGRPGGSTRGKRCCSCLLQGCLHLEGLKWFLESFLTAQTHSKWVSQLNDWL